VVEASDNFYQEIVPVGCATTLPPLVRRCCRWGRGHVAAAFNPETAGGERPPRDRVDARDFRDGRIPDDRSQIVRTDYKCA
jgi:hypothetical protein